MTRRERLVSIDARKKGYRKRRARGHEQAFLVMTSRSWASVMVRSSQYFQLRWELLT
jgi:hypothetical protein